MAEQKYSHKPNCPLLGAPFEISSCCCEREKLLNKYIEYIGDGVTASYDGHRIWLEVDDYGITPQSIGLDVTAQANLFNYINRLHVKLANDLEQERTGDSGSNG